MTHKNIFVCDVCYKQEDASILQLSDNCPVGWIVFNDYGPQVANSHVCSVACAITYFSDKLLKAEKEGKNE
jgi:hypothetical protein